MIKKTYDLTEFSERERLTSDIHDNAVFVNDNEKYLAGDIRVDFDRCEMGDDTFLYFVAVLKFRPSNLDILDKAQHSSEPFMGFVLDDLGKARGLTDFIVGQAREQPAFDDMWDNVCGYWEAID